MYKFMPALVSLSVAAAAMGSFSFAGAATLKTFTITESFGVSHPDQIIDFDYSSASALPLSSTCLVGPSGTQVPFQILSGDKIAIRTSLSANTSKTWQLMSNCTPSATPYSDQVVIDTSNPDYIQITNGITGVRAFNYHGQTRTIPITSASVSNNVITINTAIAHHLEALTVNRNDYPEFRAMGTSNNTVTISSLTGACSYLNGARRVAVVNYWNRTSPPIKYRSPVLQGRIVPTRAEATSRSMKRSSHQYRAYVLRTAHGAPQEPSSITASEVIGALIHGCTPTT